MVTLRSHVKAAVVRSGPVSAEYTARRMKPLFGMFDESVEPADDDSALVERLRSFSRWAIVSQFVAFVVACSGSVTWSDAHLPILGIAFIGVAGALFLSSIAVAGVAAWVVVRYRRRLTVLQIIGGLLPWFLVIAEASLFLYLRVRSLICGPGFRDLTELPASGTLSDKSGLIKPAVFRPRKSRRSTLPELPSFSRSPSASPEW
jgi:hypothetical protein